MPVAVSVASMFQRVGELVPEHRHWFEAVSAWYGAAKWTKKVFTNYLAVRNKPVGLARLLVNDRPSDEDTRDRDAPTTTPTWWIPSSALRSGENQIVVLFEQDAAALTIDGINVEHSVELTAETKRDMRPRPKATAQTAIAVTLGSGYRPQADRWMVQVQKQAVRFSLHLDQSVPPGFLVGLSVQLPMIGYSLILEDIWDHVTDMVKNRIKKLVKDYYRRLASRDAYANVIESQLRDLRGYMELHESHLAHAVSASDEMTLEDIISKSRPTSSLTSQEPVTVRPVESEPPVVRPVREQAPPRPRARSGMHPFLRFLFACFLLGVVAAAGVGTSLYLGWIRMPNVPDVFAAANPNAVKPMQGDPAEPKRQLEGLLRTHNAAGGDVQISLRWFNKNDLDLHVIAPSGEKLWHRNLKSKCGGSLNVDMNAKFPEAKMDAIENVAWPQGNAPKGRYKVYVDHYKNHGGPDCQDPSRYLVRVVVRGQERWFEGQLVFNPGHEPVPVHEFVVD